MSGLAQIRARIARRPEVAEPAMRRGEACGARYGRNPMRAARSLGVEVRLASAETIAFQARAEVGTVAGLYRRGIRQPTIYVFRELPLLERDITLAHELGHHILGFEAGHRADDYESPDQVAADAFALGFLGIETPQSHAEDAKRAQLETLRRQVRQWETQTVRRTAPVQIRS